MAPVGSASSNVSPARFDTSSRNRPALGSESMQQSSQLFGQRHINTERAGGPSVLSGNGYNGTHSAPASWPRSDGANEDAASLKRRLQLNNSAARQVRHTSGWPTPFCTGA